MNLFSNKKFGQKIIIALVIVILFNFVSPRINYGASILVEPIVDLSLAISDGIMTIMQKGVLGIEQSFVTVEKMNQSFWGTVGGVLGGVALGAAAIGVNFIPGLGQVVSVSLGTVAVATLAGAYGGYKIASDMIPQTFKVPIFALGPGEIFANKIPMLDVNFFNPSDYSNVEIETGEGVEASYSGVSIAETLRDVVSGWYYTLRTVAFVCLMLVLAYVGIKMIMSSSVGDKAKYKQYFFDWLIAMCLLFCMHYIMAFSLMFVEQINSMFVTNNAEFVIEFPDLTGYSAEIGGEEVEFTDKVMWPTTLVGGTRVQLQLVDEDSDNSLSLKMGYTIMYVALVFYTLYFLLNYLKRVVYMAFLTIIAPLVAMTYPIDKINDGKAQAFDQWMKEYIFNLLIQPLHLLLYYMLIGSAVELAAEFPIYAIVALGFMLQAENLMRKFFGFNKAETSKMNSALGGAMVMQGINSLSNMGKKLGGGKSSSNTKQISKDKDGIKFNRGQNTNSLMNGMFPGEEENEQEHPLVTGSEGRQNTSNETDANSENIYNGESYEDFDPMSQYYNDNPEEGDTSNTIRTTEAQPIESQITEEQQDEEYKPREVDFGQMDEIDPDANPISEEEQKEIDRDKKRDKNREIAGAVGRTAGKVAMKGADSALKAAPGLIKGGAKMYTRAVGAGVGATMGVAAGLVSDDGMNVLKYGAAAGTMGGFAGNQVGSLGVSGAELIHKKSDEVSDIFNKEYYGDGYEEHQIQKADKKAEKDKDRQALYAKELGLKNKSDIKDTMAEATKYRENGVTDDEMIIAAMQADSSKFGGSTSDERMLLASAAEQVKGNRKDLEYIEKGLKSRGASSDEIKKYSDEIKKIHGWV